MFCFAWEELDEAGVLGLPRTDPRVDDPVGADLRVQGINPLTVYPYRAGTKASELGPSKTP